ncbi:MAG: hypothetical protein ACXWUN_04945 [Allosphingosinicella sp.]
MSVEDVTYYEQRAQTEIELAQRATHTNAAQAHYEMATAYLDRIHGAGPTSKPNALLV